MKSDIGSGNLDEGVSHTGFNNYSAFDVKWNGHLRGKAGYVINSDVNFRWGLSHHIKVSNHDLYDAIDSIIDKLKHKISKEKEKIQEH